MTAPIVYVLDCHKRPLMPTNAARARKLLKKGHAAVFRIKPFTIIMKNLEGTPESVQPWLIKPARSRTIRRLLPKYQPKKDSE